MIFWQGSIAPLACRRDAHTSVLRGTRCSCVSGLPLQWPSQLVSSLVFVCCEICFLPAFVPDPRPCFFHQPHLLQTSLLDVLGHRVLVLVEGVLLDVQNSSRVMVLPSSVLRQQGRPVCLVLHFPALSCLSKSTMDMCIVPCSFASWLITRVRKRQCESLRGSFLSCSPLLWQLFQPSDHCHWLASRVTFDC